MAVQISTFGFFAAVIGCAASTRGSWFQHAQEIAMRSRIWNVRMQSWLRKNTNTSKNAQVLWGQDAIIIVDNAGVLRQGRAFEVPTIPFEHFAEAKNEIVNLENAKDYAETSFNVRRVSSGAFQKGDHDELLGKAVPRF